MRILYRTIYKGGNIFLDNFVENPKFNEDVDIANLELQLGIKFTNATIFRAMLREHVLRDHQLQVK